MTTELESKLLTYVVRFFNPVNQNHAATITVQVEHVKDAVETAIKELAELGHDVSSHNSALTTEDGQGVAGTDDVATVAQLQRQLEEIQRQISAHSKDNAEGTPTTPPPPVNSDVKPDPAYNPANSGVSPGLPSEPTPVANTPFSQSDVDSAIPPA